MDKTMDQLARENFKRKQKMEHINYDFTFQKMFKQNWVQVNFLKENIKPDEKPKKQN